MTAGRRTSREVVTACFVVASVTSAACGAREALPGPGERPGEGGAGGTDGAGGGGASVASGGGGTPPPPRPECGYALPEEPLVLFEHPDGLHSPQLEVVASGAEGEPTRVAYAATFEHFWHPDIRVAEVSIGAAWPEDVQVTRPMKVLGVDAHAPGALTFQDGVLALAYFHADEASPNVIPGVKLRPMSPSTWTPQAETFVEEWASFAYGVAGGPSPDGGTAWLVGWRGVAGELVEPRVAITDVDGNLLRAPVAVSSPSGYPGDGLDVARTSSAWLVAVSRACAAEAPCAPRVEILAYAPGSSVGGASLTPVAQIPALSGRWPRTPTIVASGVSASGAPLGGPGASDIAAWVAWREPAFDEADTAHVVRAQALSAAGEPIGSSRDFLGYPVAGPVLHASDQGTLLGWGEEREPALGEHVTGHSAVVLQQIGKEGQSLQTLEVATTALSYLGLPYATASVEAPRGMLLAWSGAALDAGKPDVTYLTRLACVDPP